jgi:hypothetical protein
MWIQIHPNISMECYADSNLPNQLFSVFRLNKIYLNAL